MVTVFSYLYFVTAVRLRKFAFFDPFFGDH